ncbi:MAG: hypothetical protein HUU18_00370 [Phycisphaerales bacterium]|nr:hypothetical protein [Phycisphaerales bacterium]
MNRFVISLAICVLAVQSLAGPDFNPPSWRGLPNSTTQGWDFLSGNTHPGDLPDDRVVPLRNPNEVPAHIVPFRTNPTSPNIPFVYRQRVSQPHVTDTFLTLLGAVPDDDPAYLMMAIPNYQSNQQSLMRIQLTYRVASIPMIFVSHLNGMEHQIATTELIGFNDRFDPERGNWRQATVDFEFGRTTEWHLLLFINHSGLELDIESIVVDTIVPAPGITGMMMAFGMIGLRRRRPREYAAAG